MLKKYQKSFIILNMLFIGSVLLAVMVAISVYMYHDYDANLKNTMEQMLRPLKSPSEHPGAPPDNMDEKNLKRDDKKITTIFYSTETEKISIVSKDENIDQEWIKQAVSSVINQENSYGTLSQYNIIYYKTNGMNDIKIALTDTDYIYSSMLNLFLILLLIFAVSMLLFFLISYYISKLAVRPLQEAWDIERQFVSDLSHDLKTPLTIVLANNSILNENQNTLVSKQKQWIDSTQDAAKNMLNIINEMLTLSALDTSELTIAKTPIDFSSVAAKTAMQMESVVYDKGIEQETQIDEGIAIYANEEYMQRVCTSLIDNALKYEPIGGKIKISLKRHGKKAVFEVCNYNAIISKEDLPHIFERFYRTDKSRSEKQGHGLGLSIAKRMTELMGGRIEAESSAENGTVFRVSFSLLT